MATDKKLSKRSFIAACCCRAALNCINDPVNIQARPGNAD